MAGITNKGKYRMAGAIFRGETLPTNFYVALVTDTPDADTNTLSDLTEIADGNGYDTGGFELTPGGTDFDTWTEDDSGNKGVIKIKDVAWTADGGSIPASGDDALYAVLLDDNGTIANREVWVYWSLGGAQSIGDGSTITLQDLEIDFSES